MVKERESERAVQQFNGREGETATLLKTVSVFSQLVWRRFRPTSDTVLQVKLLLPSSGQTVFRSLTRRKPDESVSALPRR